MSRNQQHRRKRQKQLCLIALLLCLAVLGFSVWLLFIPNTLNRAGESSALQNSASDSSTAAGTNAHYFFIQRRLCKRITNLYGIGHYFQTPNTLFQTIQPINSRTFIIHHRRFATTCNCAKLRNIFRTGLSCIGIVEFLLILYLLTSLSLVIIQFRRNLR